MKIWWCADEIDTDVRNRGAARKLARKLIDAGESPDLLIELLTEREWAAMHPGVSEEMGELLLLGDLAMEERR